MSDLEIFSQSAHVAFFIKSFISLFAIVNAIGNVPIFMTLLERYEKGEMRSIVKRAVIIAAITLLIITVTGNMFFRLLHIDLYSFRIAGGILLGIVSIEMLYGRKSRTQSSADEEQHYMEKDTITIVPLAIPLLTGPGAITTGVVLFGTAKNPLSRVILVLTIPLVYLISYWILSRSGAIFRFFGRTGTKVAIRIMGLMLLSIAMQFIIDGLSEAFPRLGK